MLLNYQYCSIREYWDEKELIMVDRDINAGINIKRVGLELFPTINRRSGKVGFSQTQSTVKQILDTLHKLDTASKNCVDGGLEAYTLSVLR